MKLPLYPILILLYKNYTFFSKYIYGPYPMGFLHKSGPIMSVHTQWETKQTRLREECICLPKRRLTKVSASNASNSSLFSPVSANIMGHFAAATLEKNKYISFAWIYEALLQRDQKMLLQKWKEQNLYNAYALIAPQALELPFTLVTRTAPRVKFCLNAWAWSNPAWPILLSMTYITRSGFCKTKKKKSLC